MVKALIDSECTHTCILEDIVKKLGILLKPVQESFEVLNVDGTQSGYKPIMSYVDIALDTKGYKEQVEAVITTLGPADIFLGHNQLTHHNLEINWKEGIVRFTRCPPNCEISHHNIHVEPYIQRIQAEEEEENEEKQSDPTTVKDSPQYMKAYTYLFNKTNFDQFPECTQWDYKIKLTNNALLELKAKIYPMTLKEEELNVFVNENLKFR
ncbi:hypothetical protein AN958_11778 [Leucoagaricus sp. SymC.cos]|nr:hypothetical protein AN958_11778 [Leucoagaricus sp. SymC.cos]